MICFLTANLCFYNILIYNLFVSLLNTILLAQFKAFHETILGNSETLLTLVERRFGNVALVCLFFSGSLYAPMPSGRMGSRQCLWFLLSDLLSALMLWARVNLNRRAFSNSQSFHQTPGFLLTENAFAFKGDFHFSSVFILPWN